MTDFFADLEQEIRAAHPRRSRPVVPVAPVLMALVALVAIVSAVSLLPAGEREVAQQPPPPPGITPLPGGESCTVELGEMERRLPVFSHPASLEARTMDVTPPKGQATYLLEFARIVESPQGRYVVFPACGTTVCMWRVGTENTACHELPTAEEGHLVVVHHTERGGLSETAGLVTRGARAVRYGEVEAEVQGGFFHLVIPADRNATVEVIPAS